jgi:hypothetical protein
VEIVVKNSGARNARARTGPKVPAGRWVIYFETCCGPRGTPHVGEREGENGTAGHALAPPIYL